MVALFPVPLPLPHCVPVVSVKIRTEAIPPLHVTTAQAALKEVKQTLRQLGVSDSDIREESVSVDRTCSYCDGERSRLYSYKIDLAVLLPTIDAAVAFLGRFRGSAARTVSVGSIRFPLINPEPLVRAAQQLSIDALEQQASVVATAMGGRLGDIVALRSSDNKADLLAADRSYWYGSSDRALTVYTTGRIEMFHNFG